MISKSFLFFDGSVLLFRSQTKPSTFPLLTYLNIFWYNQIWQNNRFRYSIKCFDILSPVCNNRKRVATSWRSELYHIRRERFSFFSRKTYWKLAIAISEKLNCDENLNEFVVLFLSPSRLMLAASISLIYWTDSNLFRQWTCLRYLRVDR